MNASMSAIATSRLCCRAPMAIRLASLCCRASSAVPWFQTRAARAPFTLLAAICSPLPEPPNTTPRVWMPAAWSRTTASAVLMQKLG